MSGPEDGRGRDAFDDFFGDPSPSGRMGPASAEPGKQPEVDTDSEQTKAIDLGEENTFDVPTGRSEPAPAAPPPIPSGAVPEDWWTSEAEPSAGAAPSSTWQAAPGPPPQPAAPPPRRSFSPLALTAMLVGGVLLGGLCVGGAVVALDQNREDPVASQTTVTETSQETPSSTTSDTPSTSSSTSSSSTSTSSSSSSSSPTRSGQVPAGVTSCAGPSSGVAVGRGTDVTTCDFAVAVRDAYVAKKAQGSVRLDVRSPVTKKGYTMSCTGQAITRCTGGNNAVVVLY